MPRPSTSSGGCQCGAVRYRINGPMTAAAVCHCRMCQKAFGNFGAVLVAVPLAQVFWTRGTPAVFRSSAIVSRGFCAACGTPLFMHEDGDAAIEIAAGSLDDPDVIPPFTAQSGTESKTRWFDRIATLPARTTEAERSPADLAKLASLQHPDYDTEAWP